MVVKFLFSLFLGFQAHAQHIKKIAVIDTGFYNTPSSNNTPYLCKWGHKDFSSAQAFIKLKTTVDPVPLDVHGHGTNIVGVIIDNAVKAKVPFCIVVIKYFGNNPVMDDNLRNSINAINYAKQIGADMINYSGGGTDRSDEEVMAVKAYIDGGGMFIAAAGNERNDLGKTPYYPAMADSRVVVVGNVDRAGRRVDSSNYGRRINRWEMGNYVDGFGLLMNGTSQACAIATGKLLEELKEFVCKPNNPC